DQINTLYDVTQKMTSTLNSDEVMRTLITSAMQLDRPSSCSLVLFNDKGEGYFGATVGITAEERRQNQLHPFTMEHPIVKQAIAERKGIYAPDVDLISELRTVLQRAATRSFYSVPMLNDDRVIGSLNLSFDKPYTMPVSHWNLLSALTQQAALALERTRLFTDAERSAREMTGLYHIGLATTSSLQI